MKMKLLKTDLAARLLPALIAILILVLSVFLWRVKVPQSAMITKTVTALENSEKAVLGVAGSATSISLGMSALPGDFGTPLAETIADLDKYCLLLLSVIFVEKIVAVKGCVFAFAWIIPIACVLFAIGALAKWKKWRDFGIKLALVGLALVFLMPLSFFTVEKLGCDFVEEANEVVVEAKSGVDLIYEANEESSDQESFFEKIERLTKATISGMSELMDYFKALLEKFIRVIAKMLAVTILTPILVIFLFRFILRKLFAIDLPEFDVTKLGKKKTEDKA